MSKDFYCGLDLGSSRAKLVLIDEDKNILGQSITRSGSNFNTTANNALNKVLSENNLDKDNLIATVSCGYGRENVEFANAHKTELGCHAKGSFHYFPFAINVIDIGGQDNKIIKIDENGKRRSFKMNRKCAAGTGAFIEEMAMRLDLNISDLNQIASSAEGLVTIGSYCTVFSATEVLEHIRNGKKVEDLVKGIFASVVKRIIEMDSFEDKVVMSGGVVQHNPLVAEMMSRELGIEVLTAKYPQLTGAMGAALYALELQN